MDKTKRDPPRALNKYEKARVVGSRAEQLARGALTTIPAIVEARGLDTHIRIAQAELAEGRIPFLLERPYPGGSYELLRIGPLKNGFHRTHLFEPKRTKT